MSRTTDHRQIATHIPSLWRDLMRAMFGYRPERHYMRGPGPAWRAKNAGFGKMALHLSLGNAPEFVEVGEAGIAVDHAMRRQLAVQSCS